MFIIQLVGLLLYLLPFGVISIPSDNCSIAELLSSPLWLIGLQLLTGGFALDVALVAFIMAIRALRAPVLLTKSELGTARNFRVSPTGASLSIIRLCFTVALTFLMVLEFCWLSPELRLIYFYASRKSREWCFAYHAADFPCVRQPHADRRPSVAAADIGGATLHIAILEFRSLSRIVSGNGPIGRGRSENAGVRSLESRWLVAPPDFPDRHFQLLRHDGFEYTSARPQRV
jgi:hypothetical protein